MGFGAPQVIGGMTAEEQTAILEKQNQWAIEADQRRDQMMKDWEAERTRNAQQILDATKQAEMAKISEQQAAEQSLADEIRAYEEAARSGTISDRYTTFLESLNQGMATENRPDTPTP